MITNGSEVKENKLQINRTHDVARRVFEELYF